MPRRNPVQSSWFKAQGSKFPDGLESRRHIRALVRRLLKWFSLNARDLPWRRTGDPYAIWVSEIMLHQTQVKTVIPYWERWMRELPGVQALAHAKPERVLKLWEGLGYYTRARNLHMAARFLAAHRRAQFPREFSEVLALPGVGRYTAGAICSIAFNQPTPVLDGNVTRVLARLFEIDADPREGATQAVLWRFAETLVTQAAAEATDYRSARTRHCAGNCSLLNQSLMEFGAVICTPRQPRCSACPLRAHCLAFKAGRVAELPRVRPRDSVTARHFLAVVAGHRGHFLVRQRPAGTINGQLWEFPALEVDGRRLSPQQSALALLGTMPDRLSPLCTVRHTITSSRITLHAFSAKLRSRRVVQGSAGRWLTLRELARLPFPSAHRQVLEHLASQLRSTVRPRRRAAKTKEPRAGLRQRGAVEDRSRKRSQPKKTLATS